MPRQENKPKPSDSWFNRHLIATLILIPIFTGIISSVIVLAGQVYLFHPIISITNYEQTYTNSYINPLSHYNQSNPMPANKTYVELYIFNQGNAPCDRIIFNVSTKNNVFIANSNVTVYPLSVQRSEVSGTDYSNTIEADWFIVSIYDLPSQGYAYVDFLTSNYGNYTYTNYTDNLYANVSVHSSCDSDYKLIETSNLNNKFFGSELIEH